MDYMDGGFQRRTFAISGQSRLAEAVEECCVIIWSLLIVSYVKGSSFLLDFGLTYVVNAPASR